MFTEVSPVHKRMPDHIVILNECLLNASLDCSLFSQRYFQCNNNFKKISKAETSSKPNHALRLIGSDYFSDYSHYVCKSTVFEV